MKWWKVGHRSWQSRGHGFDSHILHPENQRVTEVRICDSFLFARILPEDESIFWNIQIIIEVFLKIDNHSNFKKQHFVL